MGQQNDEQFKKDELDLLELLMVLKKSKWFIVFSICFSISASLAYLWFREPVFEAKILVAAPAVDEKDSNAPANISAYIPLSKQIAYAVFCSKLFSHLTIEEFKSKQKEKLNTHETIKEKKSGQILFESHKVGYWIKAHAMNPQTALKSVEEYISMTERKTLEQMDILSKNQLVIAKARLKERIVSLNESADKRREIRISHLKNELAVAKSVGYKQLQTPTNKEEVVRDYLRGTEALKAEIINLENQRVSQEEFEPDLIKLKVDSTRLDRINISSDNKILFDSLSRTGVTISDKSILLAPERLIGIAAFLGFMFASLWVTVQHIRKRMKNMSIIA